MAKGIWLKAKAREGRASGRERVHIRQQLPPSLRFGAASQELRDRNLLLHVDRNRWRLP